MGGAACIIIINGNQAYSAVEKLTDRFHNVDVNDLEAAINASCDLTSYVSLYLHQEDKYLGVEYTQPIINLHRRIIDELAIVQHQADAQILVNELAKLLFAACENMIQAIDA